MAVRIDAGLPGNCVLCLSDHLIIAYRGHREEGWKHRKIGGKLIYWGIGLEPLHANIKTSFPGFLSKQTAENTAQDHLVVLFLDQVIEQRLDIFPLLRSNCEAGSPGLPVPASHVQASGAPPQGAPVEISC